jgi:putative ABC transport system permease protein
MMSFWKSRRHKDIELETEIQNHIELSIREKIERGQSPEEARAEALREFGNVALVQEVTREMWSCAFLARLAQDLRFGFRMLLKSPGFSLVVILTLALGIGATTASFSLVYGVVLRPLRFGDSERLVAIWTRTPQVDRLPMAAADHRDIKEQSSVFEDIAILRATINYNLSGDGEPEWLLGSSIPANLFPLLQVEPLLGRGFTAEENQPGRDHEVILSHALWQRRYGGDSNIVGKDIRLENIPYTVVGVMGPGFQYPSRDVQIWTPLTINPADFQTHTGYGHLAVARLRPGATVAQAQNELMAIAARLAQQYPVKRFVTFGVAPLREDIASPAEKPLLILLAASFGLLLIGCCNLANLLLTRALSRGRETAVRRALGASHYQLLVQAVAELFPLLLIGAILGLLAASWGINSLLRLIPATLPRAEEISINFPVMLFSVGLLIVTAAIVLIIPLYQMRRSDLVAILRQDSRTSTSSKTKIRNLLVVSQVALTVLLLTGAGLLIRTFAALKEVNPGFRSSGVLSLRLAIPRNKYKEDQRIAALCHTILERVTALPGVESAGMGNRLPLSGPSGLSTIEFERGAGQEPGNIAATDDTTITPDYLRTMNIPLLKGRTFTEQDNINSPMVVILDEEVARRAWPGEDPIGRRVRSGPTSPWAEVVGVVGHIRHEKLETDERLQIYWNYWQRARDRMSLVVRTSGDPHVLVTPVLDAIKSIDADQPTYAVRTMSEVVDQSISLRWFNALVVSLFAGSSLLLAMVGIYGVIAWTVKQQTREIAVRIALGANRRAVLTMVLGKGLRMTAVGIVLGVFGSFVVTRFLRSLLFGVTQTDPYTFVAVPTLLMVAAMLACLVPALRAIRVDPMAALKCE